MNPTPHTRDGHPLADDSLPSGGAQLRAARRASGLTLAQVREHMRAAGYKFDRSTVASVETGHHQASASVLLRLCNLYGIDDPLPVLASFGHLHPALHDVLRYSPERQRDTAARFNVEVGDRPVPRLEQEVTMS